MAKVENDINKYIILGSWKWKYSKTRKRTISNYEKTKFSRMKVDLNKYRNRQILKTIFQVFMYFGKELLINTSDI